MAIVTTVSGNPTLKYSQKDMETYRRAFWMTIRLATEPSTARFPASANNGCARAIHAEPGQSADGQYKASAKKDERGSQHTRYFLLKFGDSHHNSLIVGRERLPIAFLN
jgi:hypothetical protein